MQNILSPGLRPGGDKKDEGDGRIGGGEEVKKGEVSSKGEERRQCHR